jgi:hypothetical protein
MMRGVTVSEPAPVFEIVLLPLSKEAPIPLRSTDNADKATMEFHEELQRLMKERVQGELVILQHGEQASALLRQPLP